MGQLIRQAHGADAAALWRAEVETAKTPGRLVSRPHELSLDAFESKIEELASEGTYIVACDDDGEVCGHAFLEPLTLEARRHVYSLTVVVHPGRAGRGVGTALVEHLQRWAVANDVRKVELLVRETNEAALRLYRKLGFVEEGRLRERVRLPDGSVVDDVAMAWFPSRER